MAEPVRVRDLLRAARAAYDAPSSPLARSASAAWRQGFASGGDWMSQALGLLRGTAPLNSPPRLQALGWIKYGLAGAGAAACIAVAILARLPLVAFLCIPAFYAIEAQMVFLFPLALDGSSRPFRDARVWTVHAGGTLAVLRTVLPIACTMLLGGFAGRGFVRSWCLGCLAVCVWYEGLRTHRGLEVAASARVPS
jgi:hypothetical protein